MHLRSAPLPRTRVVKESAHGVLSSSPARRRRTNNHNNKKLLIIPETISEFDDVAEITLTIFAVVVTLQIHIGAVEPRV